MRLKQINRTSTFAWSPNSFLPLLATGTVAGALDENFSNEGKLEIWAPDFRDLSEGNEPDGVVTTTSRFNRLAWGHVTADRPKGVIAAGMESGELGLWDPAKILENSDSSESLISNTKKHTNSVRGLDFNSLQTNLLASGAAAGEIYIWDLLNPTKPYTPTGTATPNPKLDIITSLAWNSSVPHVLASSSSTGYTVVWDLRGKREVVALAYGGGAATGGGAIAGGRETEIGRRRGMSDVCWHPENPTRLVTSSEDDTSPIIMLWDLRNSRAPEKILSGHEKGVLSVSWCKQDADLLLSCGKDNRSLCWNPQAGEIIGELPPSNNWAFQVDWCPRNPDLLATASFDGTIGLHSLQSTNEPEAGPAPSVAQSDNADIFDIPSSSEQQPGDKGSLSLKQPPKWLRRPTSTSFGFGGKLVSVHNSGKAVAHGHGKGEVTLRTVVTEAGIIERLETLKKAQAENNLQAFVETKTDASIPDSDVKETWRALASLFRADNRDELITLLGFSKEEVKERVKEATEKLKLAPSTKAEGDAVDPKVESMGSEPTVTFAEEDQVDTIEESEGPQHADGGEGGDGGEAPSETSIGATSDATKITTAPTESTETTEPSLFGEDIGPVAPGGAGTPALDAAADFFSSMGTIRSALPDRVLVPHHGYPVDSSRAATVGSRSSSVADLSEGPTRGGNTFKIYPSEESEVDRLVTKSLVLGDFESAVELCLSADRFADAILLAVKGGPELLQATQKTYFERRTTALPYLRLFQSIVSDDLADIVQNADLREWQEIFVVLCTFAKSEDFAGLAEQLGQRLEFQGRLVGSDADGKKELRKNATLCYLAAGRLERVVGIWVEEMREEAAAAELEAGDDLSKYDVHAFALQTFIEKVTVFRGATGYVDLELTQPTESQAVAESGARTYKLEALYDRYYEYADLLAGQGLVEEAVKYVAQTPSDYLGSGDQVKFDVVRDRLLKAANIPDGTNLLVSKESATTAAARKDPGYFPQVQPEATPLQASNYPNPYAPNGPAAAPAPPGAVNPYAPTAPSGLAASSYEPAFSAAPPPAARQAYQPTAPMTYPSNSYSVPQYGQPAYPAPPPTLTAASIIPPPPPPIDNGPPPAAGPAGGARLPPPPRGPTPGWNDTPAVDMQRRGPASLSLKGPAPITAPFPNSPQPATPASPYAHPVHQPMVLPPPPRGGTLPPQPAGGPPPRGPPPPGQGGQPRPPPPSGPYAAARPGQPGPPQPYGGGPGRSGPPQGGPYPGRVMSPANGQGGPYPPGPPTRALSPPQQGPPPRQSQGPPPRGPPGPPAPPGPPGAPRQAPYSPANGPGAPGASRPLPPAGAPGQASWQPQVPRSNPPVPQGPPAGAYGPPGGSQSGPPPGPGLAPQQAQGPPRSQTPSSMLPPPKQAPAPPKYPSGDRSHIPESLKPVYSVLNRELDVMKQNTPPQQKKVVDDTERRLNTLYDALNCESLSPPVVQQLQQLVRAMEARDGQAAMGIHVRLLTTGGPTDQVAAWGPGIKQLLNRMSR